MTAKEMRPVLVSPCIGLFFCRIRLITEKSKKLEICLSLFLDLVA